MSTYGEVKARIAREMHRADLTADIVVHVRSAIEHYAARRTWKNTGQASTVTVAGQATCAQPSGLRQADRVAVVIDGQDYPLKKRTGPEITDMQGGAASEGQPTDYAWEGALFRLWPTPDAVYAIRADGVYDDTSFADDASSNSWTTLAEDLVVAHAKETLSRDVTVDPEMEGNAARAARMARNKLFRETGERLSAGKLTPGW